MAELFQTSVPNINIHLKGMYDERELTAEATIKSYLIVQAEHALSRTSRSGTGCIA
jgi:hypothetical protein